MSGLSSLINSLDIDQVKSDQRLDIVYGCAGLIGPLLKIGSSRALLLAREAGTHLVDRQDACGGWVIGSVGAKALTGFSHGGSGMAAALARLHLFTGQSSYLDAAAGAMLYERKNFDVTERNWPDFRGKYDSVTPRFMLSWCHGAPGVALSRLCMSDTSLFDEDAKEELQNALETTTNNNVAGDSVCCGRFGRAAILRLGARDAKEPKWLNAAIQLEMQGLRMKRANGAYSFQDMLGLFTGAAGVGLALLDSVSGDNCYSLPSILSAGLYHSARQD
jgi:lantibiotic modifying enzyme